MTLTAGFTMTVHLVELTIVRRINPGAIHGYQYLFNFQWPSLLYAIDVVAWDIFFALAILFAVPVFRACGHRTLSNWLLAAGALPGGYMPDLHSRCSADPYPKPSKLGEVQLGQECRGH